MSAVLETQPPERSGLYELVQLAWPLVLTNGIWTAQLFIDRVFLSEYGRTELAATLAAIVAFWAALNFFQHTVSYVAAFVAQYIGAGRPHQVGPIVGQAFIVAHVGGLFFICLAPWLGTLVGLLGHEERLAHAEVQFLYPLCFSAWPTLIAAATNSFLTGRGNSRIVLMISAICLGVTALLDYALIFGRWGLPEMGIAGAGWATCIGQCVGAVIGLCLFFGPRFRQEFNTGMAYRLNIKLLRRLLYFGLPNGVVVGLECAAFAALLSFIALYGEVASAASAVVLTLNIVCVLPTLGIGQAIEVLVGRYLGENRPARAERVTYHGFGIAWIMMTTIAICYFTIPNVVLMPFRRPGSGEELEMAKVLLRFVAFYSLFDSVNLVFSFALRGAGDTRFVMYTVSLLPWFTMVLPAWLAYRAGWSVYWSWAIITGYVLLLATIFILRFRHGAWKSMRVIEAVGEEERNNERP